MTNFTMPGSEQQSQFAANCKNTCETSWKNEISTINAVDADTSMPNHAKYQVAINALARFAIVHNACRDVMLEPVLPVYGQMAQPNYYNQAPGAQPFYQGSVGQQYPFTQPYQHPYQQQVITSHTLRITSESVDANNITHLAEFIYTTNGAVSLELCVVENDVVLLNIEDIRIASIAEDTDIEDGEEGVNLFHDSTVTALVIQLPEDTIRDISKVLPGLAKVVANAVNQLLPYGKGKAYGAIMPTSIGNIITDSIVVELSREQSEYITKLKRHLLKGIQIYPRTQTLMQDTE